MKYAIVTGGTSGMGMGVAKMLIAKGYYCSPPMWVWILQKR